MVDALMNADMLNADLSSTIKVDATGSNNGHLSTSLAELGQIGADAVVTDTAETFIDLGAITDAEGLAHLLDELDSGKAEGFSFVVNADGEAANSSLVLTGEQSAIAAAISNNTDDLQTKLSSIGIDHVYYADDQGEQLIIGLEDKYLKLDIT
jgi:hypothetical protein